MKDVEQVQLCIKSAQGNESLYISAFLNQICKPLTGQEISLAVNTFPHLQGLKLADSNSDGRNLNVDILIGSDFYWNFFTPTVIRSNDGGPVALGSKLGFILSGPVSAVNNQDTSTVNIACTHTFKNSN